VWGRCGLARAAPWVYDGGMSERLEKLKSMLQRQPEDAFLLYGTALEYKKMGQATEAVDYLKRVIGVDPNYCYAYHQMGLIHESQGDVEAAKSAYRQGIEAANRRGDAHAREEISGALSMIE
jgi:Tfp pilus assembly protein PilF